MDGRRRVHGGIQGCYHLFIDVGITRIAGVCESLSAVSKQGKQASKAYPDFAHV